MTVLAFCDGRLDDHSTAAVEREIDRCDSCRELVAAIARERGEAAGGALAQVGKSIGRYQVVELIGRGTMGVVVRAHDPDVNRDVAVKLLERSLGSPTRSRSGRRERTASGEPAGSHGGEGAGSRDRLLREARAMGRLAHPNVVRVYDVGEAGDAGDTARHVFVAMELVSGANLSAWLAAGPRAVREVVEVFAGAAEGLAAAHAVGVVHRDFKPDNVLVDESGAARVTDFGLAEVADPAAVIGGGSGSEIGDETLLLSRTGSLTGTPAYMAPEQWDGQGASARSDQFSFFVALWEALAGERPFAGDDVEALARSVRDGRRRAAPAVPRALRRTLERGLAVDPDARFGSMSEVARALRGVLGARRRRALVATSALAGVLLAGAGVLAWRGVAGDAEACGASGPGREIAATWTPARRAELEAAFARTRVPFQRPAFVAAAAGLDRYARRWIAGHVAACRATRVDGSQSEDLMDRRMICLRERRLELAALVDRLGEPTPAAVEHAADAVARLGDLDACGNLAALRQTVAPPSDPAAAARAEAIMARLAEVKSYLDTAGYPEGLAAARLAADEARALGHRPLEGEALYRLGTLEHAAGDPAAARATFERALLAAEAGRHLHLRALIHLELVGLVGNALALPDQARTHVEHGRAVIESLGGDELLAARFDVQAGVLVSDQDRHAEALELYRRALPVYRRRLGERDVDVGHLLDLMAIELRATGEIAPAMDHHERALRIIEDALGKDHPTRANVLSNLAGDADMSGDRERALSLSLEAHRIREATLGPEHPDLARSHGNVGAILQTLGRVDESRPHLEAALAIKEKSLGGEHPSTGVTLITLARLEASARRREEALEYATRAEKVLTAALGDGHSMVGEARAELGRALLGLDRMDQAIAPIQSSIDIMTATGAAAPDRGIQRFNLALAEWHRGQRARGVALARAARAELAEGGDAYGPQIAAVDAFLDRSDTRRRRAR